MFNPVILCVFVILTAGAVVEKDPLLNGRIVGGSDTTIENYPYQLSLQILTAHFCGASILTEFYALTAAHCTYKKSLTFMSVRAGSTNGTSGQISKVQRVVQHPKYDPTTSHDYDVAVLRLKKALIVGPGVQPIALGNVNEDIETGTLCTATGWGQFSAGGEFANNLQVVQIPKANQLLCKLNYGFNRITDRMICFGYEEGGKDVCKGDSGGPLVCGSVQVAINSWGKGCAVPDYPGVYTNIANKEINDFIMGTLV